MSSTTTITTKYLKEAKYESKLFKVCEYTPNEKLNKFIKVWEDMSMIYLKEKHLKDDLVKGNYYKMKLYFDDFTNDEGKYIMYIKKIRYKLTDYQELPVMNELSEDSDY